jgi:hypothetical protein
MKSVPVMTVNVGTLSTSSAFRTVSCWGGKPK